MNEQDIKDIEDVDNIKKEVSAYLDRSLIIQKIVDVIDTCKFIKFKNERVRKYIDKNKPTFNLFIDVKEILDSKYTKSLKTTTYDKLSFEQLLKFNTSIIRQEIVDIITSFIHDEIHKNKDLVNSILDKQIFKDYEHDEKKLDSLLSIVTTVFGITFYEKDPNGFILEFML